MSVQPVIVGTAGWSLPAAVRDRFGDGSSALARYATRLNGTEINSSFYRPHRRSTYERWAASTPADFRFSVKVPREITHERKLIDCIAPLEKFLDETSGLADKRDVLLLQFAPSFAFDAARVDTFCSELRARFAGAVVCEPRHATWASDAAYAMLGAFAIDRVLADPPANAGTPHLENADVGYMRLHGSPRMYYDAYVHERLVEFAAASTAARRAWVIFDNTAAGHGAENALDFRALL